MGCACSVCMHDTALQCMHGRHACCPWYARSAQLLLDRVGNTTTTYRAVLHTHQVKKGNTTVTAQCKFLAEAGKGAEKVLRRGERNPSRTLSCFKYCHYTHYGNSLLSLYKRPIFVILNSVYQMCAIISFVLCSRCTHCWCSCVHGNRWCGSLDMQHEFFPPLVDIYTGLSPVKTRLCLLKLLFSNACALRAAEGKTGKKMWNSIYSIVTGNNHTPSHGGKISQYTFTIHIWAWCM